MVYMKENHLENKHGEIARRNIMEIYEGWGIFRKMLKHDLDLDRTSGRRICPLGHPDG